MRFMGRALAAGCAVAALFALPAAASAEVHRGHVSDPAGDSAGSPSQDIVGATVYYDSDGELYATATLGGSAEEMPRSLFRFTVGSLTAPEPVRRYERDPHGVLGRLRDDRLARATATTSTATACRSNSARTAGRCATARTRA